jgi:SAM-dependent methyltransferase
MTQTPDEALRRTLAAQEADLDRAALACAAHLRLPLSRADRQALDRALTALSERLLQVTMTANRIRFARDGEGAEHRQRSLAEVDARVRKLSQVIALYRRIMAARRQPLYPPDDEKRSLRSEQALASDRVQIALNKVVNPEAQDAAAETLGCWPDIPLPPSRFLHHAHAAYRTALALRIPGPLRFLDVGCGGGIKVLLAAEFFPRADGLEYDAGYAATARQVLDRAGRLPSRVIHGDALSFDGYADYDVIYFYQPMKSPEGLRALEARIAAQARRGTILIAPYGIFSDRAEALGCGRVDGAVYLAGTPAAEARAIRKRAERIGIEIPRPEDWKYLNDGYLRTLIDACHAVGYEVV